MSSEGDQEAAGTGLSLAGYIRALLAGVDVHDPAAGARLRTVAAGWSARIGLDEERVTVWFSGATLVVVDSGPVSPVDGEGSTDSRTVADILGARTEATAAVLDGRLHVAGKPERVAAMLHVIEILLDVAARVPELQRLGRDLLATIPPAGPELAATAWYPEELAPAELRLLGDLDLLPDGVRPDSG